MTSKSKTARAPRTPGAPPAGRAHEATGPGPAAPASAAPPWPAQSPWLESGLAQQDFPPGLYVVATPLGNAADVTLRALWVMRLVDALACEDTRTTGPLLARYGIHRPLVALHRHNEAAAIAPLLERLRGGARIALVSDAGTPAISDPGALLVRACHAAAIRVMPVPGPSSLSAALSVAGLAEGEVRFVGFAPAQGAARSRHWRELARTAQPLVLFEAPHRLAQTVRELQEHFPAARRVVVARELTKKFETVRATTIGALHEALAGADPRGEFVLVIDAAAPAAADSHDPVTARWLEALAAELPASRAAAVASRASGLPRDELYARLVQLAAAGQTGGAAVRPKKSRQ